jgi:hypothetical protein
VVFGWIGSGAAAAVVALVLLLNTDGFVNNAATPIAATISQEDTEPEPASPAPEPDSAPVSVPVPVPASVPATGTKGRTGRANTATDLVAGTQTAPADDDNARQEGSTEDRPSGNRPAAAGERTDNFGTPPATYPLRTKSKSWQTGLFASNVSSSASNGPEREPSPIIGDPLVEPDYTDIRHRLPVTVGLTVSCGIGERWSMSTGLNYTMLSSQFRTAAGATYYSRDQVLHNIGIPLGIDYALWRGDRLSIYLSAGGGVEKSVAGKATFRDIVGGTIRSEQENAISDKFQWSVRGAAGLQYDFTHTLGLYAEPGVNYYFDNRSGLETIYKTKPLNFGLRVGFRFSM